MHKHTINHHRIALLPARIFQIICIALTIICTFSEANGQSQQPFHYDIVNNKPSPNYNSRIRYIIIDSKDAKQYANKSPIDAIPYAHYIVSRTKNDSGQIIIDQILTEDQYVQKLNEAEWASMRYLNTFSIVITVLHITDEKGCIHFLPEQLDALAALVQDIAQRYEIAANSVLDLSDVMPGSITSTSLDWESLHKNFHIGAWPDEENVIKNLDITDTNVDIDGNIDQERFLENLALYGYPVPYYTGEGKEIEAIQKVITSFQRHFRPTKCDGVIDRETVAILEALIKKYGTKPIYFKRFIN